MARPGRKSDVSERRAERLAGGWGMCIHAFAVGLEYSKPSIPMHHAFFHLGQQEGSVRLFISLSLSLSLSLALLDQYGATVGLLGPSTGAALEMRRASAVACRYTCSRRRRAASRRCGSGESTRERYAGPSSGKRQTTHG